MKASQKRFVFLAVTIEVAVILGTFVTTLQAQAKSANDSTRLAGISAEILPQPNLSVRLDNPELVADAVSRTIRLRYVITNLGTEPLNRFSLSVLVVDPKHNVKMGSRFTEVLTVNPGETKHNEVMLHRDLYINPSESFGKYQISVVGYGLSNGWSQEFSMQSPMARLRSRNPLGALYFQDAPPPSCVESCLAIARAECADSGGIQSFSAGGTAPNCSCSFACGGRPPVQQ